MTRERVLAVAHDDDAADCVAEAVEVGDAAAQVGADADLGDVLDQDRRAGFRVGADGDALDVARRSPM